MSLLPLISVIVPIYNAENTLKKCIDSIIEQSYSNLEIILVNDGSKDCSLEICQDAELKDSRVKVVDVSNGGVSRARNIGLDTAAGEYISFIDSDDFMESNLLECLYKSLKDKKFEVSCLSEYTIKKGDLKDFDELDSEIAQKELLMLRFPTSCWAYLYSSRIIAKKRFSSEIHFFEDIIFNFEILKSINKVALCHENLYHYVTNENSINNSPLNDKRLTVLDIQFHDNEQEKLSAEIDFFYSHCLISLIVSAMRFGKIESKYSTTLKEVCRKNFIRFLRAQKVPVKYKYLIILTAINPILFIFIGNKLFYNK